MISHYRTIAVGCTSLWNCRGVLTEQYSSLVSCWTACNVLYMLKVCRSQYTLNTPTLSHSHTLTSHTGRTHRSNQVSAPEYIFLISQLSGEQRFASIVAKRLESLGALTHGDRRATESRDLSKYNLDTKAGHQSLEITLKSILGVESPMIKSEEYNQEFFDSEWCCVCVCVCVCVQYKSILIMFTCICVCFTAHFLSLSQIVVQPW